MPYGSSRVAQDAKSRDERQSGIKESRWTRYWGGGYISGNGSGFILNWRMATVYSCVNHLVFAGGVFTSVSMRPLLIPGCLFIESAVKWMAGRSLALRIAECRCFTTYK